jgi:hypothetical protein
MRHRFSAPASPPRLVLRFAVYAALTLAVAAVGFLWYVLHRYATTPAGRAVRFHSTFVADTILKSTLRTDDFQRPVSAARRSKLDALFKSQVLVGGAVRVELYGREGTAATRRSRI